MDIEEILIDIPAEHEGNVFGQFDSYVKKIEKALKVSVISRDGSVKILGTPQRSDQAARVLKQLLALSLPFKREYRSTAVTPAPSMIFSTV